ncbi:hypothetical protein D9613_004507 [Agrocybe pediades]|uniref:F-box domain-containing protein n=1 Tax=Agrocybe pediades TaxID=84607 RepID=A0A8H4QJQ1_9AGAR|nr:hypothetical protein D9613_004507 [Agrocybe pediades]
MACSHCVDGTRDTIDLSQLDYEKSECTAHDKRCGACRDIEEVEEGIANTVQRLKDLLDRHLELKTTLNHAHSSTIRDLPIEILCRIFQSCQEEYFHRDSLQEEASLAHFDVPFKLGAICRTWRQVAWSSPSLWTHISLRRCSPSKLLDEYLILEEWVPRSGALPLAVYISEYNEDRVKGGDGFWQMSLKLLAQSSARWRDVYIHLGKDSFNYLWSQIDSAPRIIDLALGRERWDDDDGNNQIFPQWKGVKLRPERVSILSFYTFHTRQLNINWSRVTHVHSESWDAKECLDLLKMAPLLQSCRFDYVGDDNWDDPPPVDGRPILHHTHLRDLTFTSHDFCGAFFDHIALPGLKRFSYSLRYISSQGQNNPSLLPFFERSSFQLTYLHLSAYTLTQKYVISLLDKVPSLAHLRLELASTDDNVPFRPDLFLQHLARTAEQNDLSNGSRPAFLPRLESFEQDSCTAYPWSVVPDVFGPPSAFGKEGRRPLKSFIVETDGLHLPPIPKEVLVKLKELLDVGAVIEYKILGCDRIQGTSVTT